VANFLVAQYREYSALHDWFAVHFLIKYRHDCSQGGLVEEGIRYVFSMVGSPLWITMVVFVSGFWVLPVILLTFNKQFHVPAQVQ